MYAGECAICYNGLSQEELVIELTKLEKSEEGLRAELSVDDLTEETYEELLGSLDEDAYHKEYIRELLDK